VNRESLNRESKQDDKVADRTSTFEDLHVYQIARDFREAMYQVAKKLPQEEKFELANQIRRAAVSLTNNIAEGHGRYHFLDQIRFTLQSRGSPEELLDDRYFPAEVIDLLKQQDWRVRQLIDGYVRYLRQQKDSAGGLRSVREESPEYSEEIDDSRFSI